MEISNNTRRTNGRTVEMTIEEFIVNDTDELEFIHSQCVYRVAHENKNYFIVGYLDANSDDYEWTAQEDNKDGDGNLQLVESPELSNIILKKFFKLMESAIIQNRE